MNKWIILGTVKSVTKITEKISRVKIVSQEYENKKYVKHYFDLIAMGNNNTVVTKYCKEGQCLLFECAVKNNSYEKDGKKIYTNQFVIQGISFTNPIKEGTKKSSKNDDDVAPFNEYDGA